MLHKLAASGRRYDAGPFTIIANLPGLHVPGHNDHGWGPLARYDESIMRPGTFIAMHEHQNDEIISYVSDGALRHTDRDGNSFVVPNTKLMVMNAGQSFWHEEQTRSDDPETRFLQIFVRPRESDLLPSIQLADLEPEPPEGWRLLVGPPGTEAPTHVRNDVWLFDAHMAAATAHVAPARPGLDTLIHVYRGKVAVNGAVLSQSEGALAIGEPEVTVSALSDAVVLAFLIDAEAPVTHAGTIGR